MNSNGSSYDPDHKKIFEYNKPWIALSYVEAMQAITSDYKKTRHIYGPLEFAVLMHCHVRDRLTINADGKPGAKPLKQKGRAFRIELDGTPLGIPRKLIFKAKKINPKLITANIPTKAVRRFNSQQPEFQPQIQYGLFGNDKVVNEPEPPHFNFGYIPNALWTGLDRLCITFLTGLRTATLVMEVPIEIASNITQVVSLPLGEITDKPKTKRVKRRQTDASTDEHKRKELKGRIKRDVKKKNSDNDQGNEKAKGNG